MSRTKLQTTNPYYVQFLGENAVGQIEGFQYSYQYENSVAYAQDNGISILIGSPDVRSHQPYVELADDSIAYIVSGNPRVKKVSHRAIIILSPDCHTYTGKADVVCSLEEVFPGFFNGRERTYHDQLRKAEAIRTASTLATNSRTVRPATRGISSSSSRVAA